MNSRLCALFTALLFAALFATAAHATPISVFFSFVASNFQEFPTGVPPPQDPVTGSVSLTYDTTLGGGGLESGSIDSIDLTIAGHVYTVAEMEWILSGTPSHPWLAILSTAVGAPSPDFFEIRGYVDLLSGQFIDDRGVAYHVLGIPGLFQTFGANIVIRDANGVIVPEVPEPSVLALLGIGLAGLGFVRRKQ